MSTDEQKDAQKSMLDLLHDPEFVAVQQAAEEAENAAMAAAKAARVYPVHYPARALGRVLRVHADGAVELGTWYADAFTPLLDARREVVRLALSCEACPEQYDAFIGAQRVGYLRLRHGMFRVDYPECGGETVYTSLPYGDGRFSAEERDEQLDRARAALFEAWLGDWGAAAPEAIAAEVARQAEKDADEARARREAFDAWRARHDAKSSEEEEP